MKATNLYIRLSDRTVHNLFRLLLPTKLSIKDKSALTVLCEELLEWATTEALLGMYGEDILKKKYGKVVDENGNTKRVTGCDPGGEELQEDCLR